MKYCVAREYKQIQLIYENETLGSRVIHAYDTQLSRNVIIKTISYRNHSDRRRIQAEIRSLIEAYGKTRYIPVVFDVIEDNANNQISIIMEKVNGKSFQQHLNEEYGRHEDIILINKNFLRLISIARTLCNLENLNPRLYHKDLKPDNVIINDNNIAFLIDFGLGSMPINQISSGSKYYRAPEQCLVGNSITDSSKIDMFSFGMILFRAFSGKNLVIDIDLEYDYQSHKWLKTPKITDFNHNVPKTIDALFAKCVAYDPKDRYRDFKTLAGELRKVSSSLGGKHNKKRNDNNDGSGYQPR